MNYFNSRCPVAKVTEESFVAFPAIGQERHRVELKRQIHWLIESESQVQYVHGGKVLKEGSIYSDYYGFLGSTRETSDLADIAQGFEISADSSLELRLQTKVKLVPAHQDDECRRRDAESGLRNSRTWAQVPVDWRYERPSPYEEGKLYYPTPEPVVLAEVTTWSSKLSAEENASRLQSFVDEWTRRVEIGDLPMPAGADDSAQDEHQTERQR